MALTEWRRLLRADDGYELRFGAGLSEVAAAEAALEAMFPEDLRQLYLASDGMFDAPAQWFVIWPIADVVIRNREAWSCEDSPSRRNLVGFGDDGTGAPFCVPRDGSGGFFYWSAILLQCTTSVSAKSVPATAGRSTGACKSSRCRLIDARRRLGTRCDEPARCRRAGLQF